MEMHTPTIEIVPFRACWMRGGTSKGVFFLENDLPSARVLQDEIILSVLGSPDIFGTQMDGLGGATSSTSKAAIVSISERVDCDVNYRFAHVSIRDGVVDYSGNCGNLAAAVGLYALEEKLVETHPQKVIVSVWQQNLQQRLLVEVPTDEQGSPLQYGDYVISGVPGSGAPISVTFETPVPRSFTHVLPTRNPIDYIDVPDLGSIQVSIIASGNPTIFVEADTFGLSGNETPTELNQKPQTLVLIEKVRASAAMHAGLISSLSEATLRLATPKIAIVTKPISYTSASGQLPNQKAMNICTRFFSMGKAHHAIPATGAIALATGACIAGTIPNLLASKPTDKNITIAHAAGLMELSISVSDELKVSNAKIHRTARTLMRGEVLARLKMTSG